MKIEWKEVEGKRGTGYILLSLIAFTLLFLSSGGGNVFFNFWTEFTAGFLGILCGLYFYTEREKAQKKEERKK